MDFAPTGMPTSQSTANNIAKESPLHLPEHNGRTKAFLCKECNEDAENERCFEIGFSVNLMAVEKFRTCPFRLDGIRKEQLS